jgi:hypothetical protein
MTTKPVDRDSRGELSIATDALANLVFSLILNCEAELVALPGQAMRRGRRLLTWGADQGLRLADSYGRIASHNATGVFAGPWRTQ